ncbi:hypothetical protein EST38_g8224 [Candolleomyces aberdarensis]|uniref:Aquaporin n=1 Tax=Candolleomyces aberdarensis TaxID=2316362 RepID=A0A4V1Q378_9AGAR|nr:hypothetical protein EST38_g8224 [Candolleomyces aberdarensis]
MSYPSISQIDSDIKKVRPTSELVTSHTVISGSDAEAQIAVVGDHTYDPQPSTYRRILSSIREPMAEFFGVALLIIFGAGSAASAVLSTNSGVSSSPKGDFFSINFGWAIGIAMGVWVSGTISGGHINPAMTLAMATWRKFPWRKVPAYILAQVLGGVVGAALVYGIYFGAIDIYEGAGVRTQATAGIFTTYSLPYMTSAAAFFTEFLTTAILSMVVLALTDKRNSTLSPGLLPLALFLLFIGFGVSLGIQTAYALNPARDFGPRLFLLMAGYGKEVFTYRNQYWLWCPIIAPIVGAQAGALLYDLFLYTGQGPLNAKGDY